MALHPQARAIGPRKGEHVVWLDILEPLANLNPRCATRRNSREVGAPDTIRTCGLHLRRVALYPAELTGASQFGLARPTCGGVADEGVPFRQIAEVIGRRLNLPAISLTPGEAARRFSWLAPFAAYDNPASSEHTRERLGWRPTRPGLLADLDREAYFCS